MGEYDRAIAMAARMIAQKGQSVTWKQPGIVGGTPAKPVSTAPALHTVNMLFLPNKRDGLASFLTLLSDTEIPMGGMRALMPAVSFTPALVDTVLRGEEELTLDAKNGIELLGPNGQTILYFLRFIR